MVIGIKLIAKGNGSRLKDNKSYNLNNYYMQVMMLVSKLKDKPLVLVDKFGRTPYKMCAKINVKKRKILVY